MGPPVALCFCGKHRCRTGSYNSLFVELLNVTDAQCPILGTYGKHGNESETSTMTKLTSHVEGYICAIQEEEINTRGLQKRRVKDDVDGQTATNYVKKKSAESD